MVSIIYRLTSLVVICTIGLTGIGSALRVITEPLHDNEVTGNQVHVTCIAAGPLYRNKKIMTIQITRQCENEPMATIVYMEQASVLGSHSKRNVTAEGYIDNDSSESYLKLTIDKPSIDDTGLYRCLIFLLEENHIITQESDTAHVTSAALDEHVLVNKVSTLMTNVSEQERNLNTFMTVQDLQIDDLKRRINRENSDYIKTQKDVIASIDGHGQRLEEFKEGILNKVKNDDRFRFLKVKINEKIDAVKKKALDALMSDHIEKQKELDTLNDLVKKQNEKIDRHDTKLHHFIKGINMTFEISPKEAMKKKTVVVKMSCQLESVDHHVMQYLVSNFGNVRGLAIHSQTYNKTIAAVYPNATVVTLDRNVQANGRISAEGYPSLHMTMRDHAFFRNENFHCNLILGDHHSLQMKKTLVIKKCPDEEWEYYEKEKTCLKVFGKVDISEVRTWSQAKGACETYQGNLVQIRDSKTNVIVFLMAFETDFRSYAWIGLKNGARDGFDFRYVDGLPLGNDSYQPWNTDVHREPDGSGRCVALYTRLKHAKKWFDLRCNNRQPYVCSTSPRAVSVI